MYGRGDQQHSPVSDSCGLRMVTTWYSRVGERTMRLAIIFYAERPSDGSEFAEGRASCSRILRHPPSL